MTARRRGALAEGDARSAPTGRWHAVSKREPAKVRRSGSPLSFWALMTFMAIALLSPQALFPSLAPFRIALISMCVAIGAHLASRWFAGRPPIVLAGEMRIAACLLVWATATIPFSYWPGGSFEELTGLFIKSLVLFWLIASTLTTVQRLHQFALGLSLMTIPLAVTAISNFRSGVFLRDSGRITGYESPLASNPNDLALTLNLVLPFVLALFRLARGPISRGALLAIALVNVVAIVATFSRAGFITLAVIVGLTIVRLLRSRRRGWGSLLLASVLLAAPFLPAAYWDRLATIADIESDATGSAQARRELIMGSLRFVASHPVIGAGLGCNVLALRELGLEGWSNVHNVYLQYAVDLGLPGLGLFLALFAACLASATSASRAVGRDADTRRLVGLAQAVKLSLTAFGAAALFHPVAYHSYFYYLGGLAVACGGIARYRARRDARSAFNA